MGKKGRREEERGREEGSYFTRGRVTCLFRVVEQIYIALSPPVIPLSRCCCRTLDSARRREIKGTAGRGAGGRGRGREREERENEGKKKENGRKKKREIYRILKYRRPRRGEMSRTLCMHCPRTPLLFLRALVFAEDYPRCVAAAARCAPFIFGSALRTSCRRRVKPACPRQS